MEFSFASVRSHRSNIAEACCVVMLSADSSVSRVPTFEENENEFDANVNISTCPMRIVLSDL